MKLENDFEDHDEDSEESSDEENEVVQEADPLKTYMKEMGSIRLLTREKNLKLQDVLKKVKLKQ